MEQEPQQPEQLSAEIRQNEFGVDVTIARRNTWHFSDPDAARRHFQRRYLQYLGLHWGARLLVVGGVVDVIRNVEQHDAFSAMGAIVVGGLVLLVEGVNEQAIAERLSLYNRVRRQNFQE